jgi:hypothetical protein
VLLDHVAGGSTGTDQASSFSGSVQESDGTRDFSGVGFPAKTGTVVVVAVGMWKPAFGAGFQAPWDEPQLCVKIPP